jgi:AraC-like DNA-binding protein
MQGIYEYSRDNDCFPACWRLENNTCFSHFHSSLELVYVTQGAFKSALNGHICTVHQNEVLLVPSYVAHYYQTEEYSDSIVMMMPLDFIPAFKKLFAKKEFSANIYRDNETNSELLHCLKLLSKNEYAPDSPIFRGYVYVIVGLLIQKVGLTELADDQGGELIRDILTYLQNSYLCPITLEGLAHNFGYSKSRFSHVFNVCFGCGLIEYVNTLRCRHTVSLMHNGAKMIDAAMNSGFESMRTFYRSFKNYYGMTPTQFISNINPQ